MSSGPGEVRAMEQETFRALHRARLVRSVLAETALTEAAAAAVADAVLAAGAERTHPSDAAAFAWCRIAARHRVAARGGTAWADAADAAVTAARVDAAQRAFATLPSEQREVLRLRYVEGLLPEAIAEQIGTSAPAARRRLDRARHAATRELHRGHRGVLDHCGAWRTRVAEARSTAVAVGAGSAVAFVLLAAIGGPAAPTRIPPQPRNAALPPSGTGNATDAAPLDAVPAAHAGPRQPLRNVATQWHVPERLDAALRTPERREPAQPPRRPHCTIACSPTIPGTYSDSVEVPLPDNPTGFDKVAIDQEVVDCAAVPAPPAGVAQCRRHRR